MTSNKPPAPAAPAAARPARAVASGPRNKRSAPAACNANASPLASASRLKASASLGTKAQWMRSVPGCLHRAEQVSERSAHLERPLQSAQRQAVVPIFISCGAENAVGVDQYAAMHLHEVGGIDPGRQLEIGRASCRERV